VVNESRRLLGGQTRTRTARSTQATIAVDRFDSAFAAALDSGFADFGRSNLTVTVTPVARPLWTAVLMVTRAFDGTEHPLRTPPIGPVS
jgi:hypothetical protein